METKCSCGHDIKSSYVENIPEYSFWGWISFSIGITTKPRRLRFRCTQCKEFFYEISDPKALEEFRGW